MPCNGLDNKPVTGAGCLAGAATLMALFRSPSRPMYACQQRVLRLCPYPGDSSTYGVEDTQRGATEACIEQLYPRNVEKLSKAGPAWPFHSVSIARHRGVRDNQHLL
jgi:hypothetical protein